MNFLTNQDKTTDKKPKPKTLFESEYLKVVDIWGYKAIQENDMIICLPYLVEKNIILLKYEEIKSYEFIEQMYDKWIVTMSKIINTDEEPVNALKTGLMEEFGIELKDNITPEIQQPLFITKGNTARFYICILPLMEHNYEQLQPSSENKEMSKIISLSLKDINNILIYDMVTKCSIDLFKKEYALI